MCTACQKMAGIGRKRKTMAKKRKSTRRRRYIGAAKGGVQSALTQTILPGVVGGVLTNYLDKLPGLSSNPQYVNYAAVAGGIALAVFTKNPMLQAAGAGMAIVGGKKVVDDLLDGQVSGLGLLSPGARSFSIGETAADVPQIEVK